MQSQHASASPVLALCCLSPRVSLFTSSVWHRSRKVAPEGRCQAFAQRAASNVQTLDVKTRHKHGWLFSPSYRWLANQEVRKENQFCFVWERNMLVVLLFIFIFFFLLCVLMILIFMFAIWTSTSVGSPVLYEALRRCELSKKEGLKYLKKAIPKTRLYG